MGIRSTIKSIVTPSSDKADCIEIEPRWHPCSGIVVRDGWGDSSDGSAWSNSGYDLCLVGEDEKPDIVDAPFCDCSNNSLRSGGRRAFKPDGNIGWLFEPQARKWQQYSSFYSNTGNGPVNDKGDNVLISPIEFSVKATCYPLIVDARLEVCGWFFRPPDVEKVAAYGEWVSTVTSPSDQADVDDVVEISDKERCNFFYAYGGSIDKHIDQIRLEPKDSLDLKADLGLTYFDPIDVPFTNSIGSARWVVDIVEDTSYGSSDFGSC